MKKIKKGFLVVLFFLFTLVGVVYAEELQSVVKPINIHLTIITNSGSIYDKDLAVNPCNSDNGATEALLATAYCAILQSEGVSSDWNWQWAPGAFLNSINDIEGYTSKDSEGNDVYHFWSWDDEDSDAENTTALNQYELKDNDVITLTFIDPVEPIEPIEPTPALSIPEDNKEDIAKNRSGSSRRIRSSEEDLVTVKKAVFDIQKAFEFLVSQQKENGSFGADLYTDWTTLALASGNYQEQAIKLIKYFEESKIESMLLTDYERRTMALLALGLNPYNTNGENYIKKITESFDGKQFGDVNEDNDDIFALIVLQNVGFLQTEKMISDDITFILNRQKVNGSWDDSIDMTGAGMQALMLFNQDEQIKNSLTKAREFLKQSQRENGGWGNVSSTAWAIGGILALNEKSEDWVKNGNTPLDYLGAMQDIDGGIKNDIISNRIWETAYVISALSGKTWNKIMQKFNKPVDEINKNKEIKTVKTPAVKSVNKKSSSSRVVAQNENTKNQKRKIENSTSSNIATVISAIDTIGSNIKYTENKSWFRIILGEIFGF